MAINRVLKQLRHKNIQLILDEQGNLKAIAEKGTLDDVIKAELKSNKVDLIDWLKSLPQSSGDTNLLPLLPIAKGEQNEEQRYPLSHAQQRLWFVSQLEKDSTAYTIAAASKITGNVSSEVLFAAASRVVRRHESLRTHFGHIEGDAYQIIVEDFELDANVVDLVNSPVNDANVEQRLQVCLAEEVEKKFDLECGPLFRLRLYRVNENEHVLFIGFHHIISDGWSNHIFLAELAFYYDAIKNGNHEAELPVSALQYKDFAVWQRRCLEDGYKERSLHYWRQQLDGWQVLNLIHDNQRSAQLKRTGGRYVTRLEPDLVEAVRAVSQRQSITLFTQLLSIFYVLMSKLSGQTDICLGTDVANRTRQEVEDLIGFFVNQLVLRADLSDNPSFEDFVRRIRQMTLDAYQHQDLPFDILVDELLEHHDLAHSPFFPVKFIMQNTPNNNAADDNWIIEEVDLPHSHAKFEMTWSLTEYENGIEIVIEYDKELFNDDTITAYAQFYRTIAEQVVVTPNMPISEIGLCAQAEHQHYAALNRFSDRVVSEPMTLSESVEAYAKTSAKTIAVHDETGSLSYAELNQRANKLANVLQQQYCVEPESNIGVCLPSGLGYITTMVALSKLGAVLVPIDISLPIERAAQIVEEADFTVIVSDSDSLDVLPTYELNFIGLCCLDEIGDELAAASDENLGIVVSEDQLAYMIFTSGTTGKPKGVMVSYKGCRTLAAEQRTRFFVTEQDRILQFASIGFDASVWEVIMALFNGASLYCQSEGQLMPGASLVEYINRFGITHVTLPPSALSVMPSQNLPSLKALILASEACNDELLEPWQDNVALFNAYGPSEATVCATIANFDKSIGGFNSSIGSPILGTDVYIIDSDGQLAPPGVSGELCIGGVSLGRGYWRDPKQTAEKFIVDSFSNRPGARLYRSGDKARYKINGGIEFLGRIDQQVKLRGYRIELQEIQNQLLKVSGIKQAVVIMHEPEQVLYAFAISDQEALNQAEIKNQLRSYLPEYMVPKSITKLTAIPTNINGKLDVSRLPIAQAHQATQDWQEQELNQRETQIHAVWLEVLDIQGVGKYETFFDVGGYSLLLIKVQEALKQRLSIDLAVSDLFKYPTIASLAEFIDHSETECLFEGVDERLSKRSQSIRRRGQRRKAGVSL